MPLPYPGRYESHDSWMRRCDEWERNRDWNRKMRNAGRGSQKMNGYIFPKYGGGKDYKVLNCRSKQNKTEKFLSDYYFPHEFKGRVVGHSLCASYTYTIVPQKIYNITEKAIKNLKFKYIWDIPESVLNQKIQEIVEQYWLLENC